MRRKTFVGGIAGAGLLVVLAAQVAAAATPEEKCVGSKNSAAGKLVACVTKALKTFYATADVTKYTAAVGKCEQKYATSWEKAENAALAAGTTCPTVDDDPSILTFVDACMDAVDDSLGGAALPLDVATCNSDLATCDTDLGVCSADLSGCESDLDDCNASLYAGLVRTGQTTCFHPTSNTDGATVSCSGSGQDGEHQAGMVRSYTDNGDGTITDNRTRLMWEKLSDDGSIHDKDTNYTGLTGALGKIATLNSASFAGYNDWRLPNNMELMSIIDYGRTNPAVNPIFHTGCTASCTVLTCSCTLSNVYHTSTTYRYFTPGQWKINFIDGDMYAQYKTDPSRVRAVRSLP